MKTFLKWLAKKNLIRIFALDEKIGNGIIHCPLCKIKIQICCPNQHVIDCPNCKINLYDYGSKLQTLRFS